MVVGPWWVFRFGKLMPCGGVLRGSAKQVAMIRHGNLFQDASVGRKKPQVEMVACPRNQVPTKIHKSLDHIRCSYLCELAPSSRRRPFDLISMHGSEFYTHAPQRAHNPKGGQQKETIQRNNPPTTQPGTSQKPNQNPPQRGLFFDQSSLGSCKTSPSQP